jgi:hypothetical protein
MYQHKEQSKPLSEGERNALKAFRQVEANKAMTAFEIAEKPFSTNRERLKTERLAWEAAGTPVATKKAEPRKIARRTRVSSCLRPLIALDCA